MMPDCITVGVSLSTACCVNAVRDNTFFESHKLNSGCKRIKKRRLQLTIIAGAA